MSSPEIINYYGCALPKLPDGAVCMGATIQIKYMDSEGDISYHEFASGVSLVEQLGMIETASDTVRSQLMNNNRKVN